MSKKKPKLKVVKSSPSTQDNKPKAKPIPISPMRAFAAEQANAEMMLSRTVDGFDNFVSRLGLNNDNTLSAGTYEFNLVTRNRVKLEAAYRGSWLVGKLIDAKAEDMTRAGINITTNESKEDIKDIESAISRLQLWGSFCDLKKWGALYGGAIGVVQVEGQDLATPINLDRVGKDQFKGIVVYDRWQVNPDLTSVIDSGPDMGLPKFYQIVSTPTQMTPMGQTPTGMQRIHFSRVIRNIGIKLPFFQAITEMMWGESLLERLWDRLIGYDNATLSATQLIDRANLRMVGVEGLREILAAGGAAQQGLLAQFEMMRSMQVNEGLTLLDKNDEYQTNAYSFAGLADMLLQLGQQLSGATDIPLVRLFGQSPAGLSATGESDMRMYYDGINAQQESQFRSGWEMVIKILWRSVYGKSAPKDMQFTFNPLWQMSAKDKAEISKLTTETVSLANEAGFVDRATGMKELRESSGDTGLFNNISDEAIKEAEEEQTDLPPGEEDLPDPNKIEKEEVVADGKTLTAWQKISKWLSEN